jgi:hypothetical protein
LAGQTKETRIKATLLYNGMAKCAQEYQAAPTVANRRNWDDAESSLEKFVAQISAADSQPPEKPLANIAEVLAYLQESDWKVTKTSLYRHHKEGKVAPRADGAYSLKDVEKYARTWLKQQSTGKKVQEKIEDLQRRKLEADLKNADLSYDRSKFAHEIALGKYLPKEQVILELTGRAAGLIAGSMHTIQSHAAEWIRLVHGDMKYVSDLINNMNDAWAEHYNDFARSPDYQIEIEAEEEVEPEC